MRNTTRSRLIFVLVAIVIYAIGIYVSPQTIAKEYDLLKLSGVLASYFVLLPIVYYRLVIVGGKQKLWKMVLPFFTSSMVCRFTLPPEFASYFDFFAYLRYPLIAVLMLIEFALLFHIVKLLWQSRKLSGDPRVRALHRFASETEQKRSTALLVAYEPACWYYMIPKFSRKHPPALGRLNLLSNKLWWFTLLTALLLLVTAASYFAIQIWSELVAIIVSSLLGYTLFSLIANYRLCRHYSLYLLDDLLVINNTYLGILVAPLSDISAIEEVTENPNPGENLQLGRGTANLKLTFSKPVCYYSMMGSITEEIEQCYLSVELPTNTYKAISVGLHTPNQEIEQSV